MKDYPRAVITLHRYACGELHPLDVHAILDDCGYGAVLPTLTDRATVIEGWTQPEGEPVTFHV